MKSLWLMVFPAGVAALIISGCSSSNPPPPAQVPPPPVAVAGPANALPPGIPADQINKLRSAAPDTATRVETGQPLTTDDVKAMAEAGFSSEVMIGIIGNSHTIYHLSADDIIGLAHSGVNSRVVDFMVATPSSVIASSPPPGTQNDQAAMVPPPGTPPPPAPPQADNTPPPPAPGPDYVWADGDWAWNGAWVWVGPHWILPPYPGAVWYHHGWVRGGRGRGYYRGRDHWR